MSARASDLLKNIRRAPEILRCAREASRWPQITSAYLGFSTLSYPCLLHLRGGDGIRLHELTDLKTFWQIFLRRVYHVEASDRTILDIGANVGLFSLYAARRAPTARVYAVEPFPSTFERLVEVVRDHHLIERVTCINCAITGNGETRLMRSDPLPSQRRALVPLGKGTSGIQVQSKTLSTLLREQGLNRVDLVKMDIEGGEYEVLLSTSPSVLRTIRRIALEYHGDCTPHTKREIFDHLRDAGFEVTSDIHDRLGYGVANASLKASPNVGSQR
ncbi:MAG TPA: FkbM family methyltransferase [Candidatus Sulfotelmatobacter sp.]|nr:FkbM family methyltransferase [Candidatus Sulfotelmatobacter sp.]